MFGMREDFQLRTSRKFPLQDQFDHTLIKQQVPQGPGSVLERDQGCFSRSTPVKSQQSKCPEVYCILVSLQVHTLTFTLKYLYTY